MLYTLSYNAKHSTNRIVLGYLEWPTLIRLCKILNGWNPELNVWLGPKASEVFDNITVEKQNDH